MEKTLRFGSYFSRYCCRKVALVFVLSAVSFHSASCGSISSRENVTEYDSEKAGNSDQSSFSHRQSPVGFAQPNIHPNNVFLNTPASFGFPMYHNRMPDNSYASILPFQFSTPTQQSSGSSSASDKNLKPEKVKHEGNLSTNGDNQSDSKLQQNKQRKRPKTKEASSSALIVESKTDDGTERACPGCMGDTCDNYIGPSTNISGIPIIQIIIGMGIGIFWATLFLFLLKNFLKQKSSGESGYASPMPSQQYGSPSTQYGTPQSGYGAPVPSSSYNNRMLLSNDYNTNGLTFTEQVWRAIDKLTEAYEN